MSMTRFMQAILDSGKRGISSFKLITVSATIMGNTPLSWHFFSLKNCFTFILLIFESGPRFVSRDAGAVLNKLALHTLLSHVGTLLAAQPPSQADSEAEEKKAEPEHELRARHVQVRRAGDLASGTGKVQPSPGGER